MSNTYYVTQIVPIAYIPLFPCFSISCSSSSNRNDPNYYQCCVKCALYIDKLSTFFGVYIPNIYKYQQQQREEEQPLVGTP